jgi:hypothetical protein
MRHKIKESVKDVRDDKGRDKKSEKEIKRNTRSKNNNKGTMDNDLRH